MLNYVTDFGAVQAIFLICVTLIILIPTVWRLADRSSQLHSEQQERYQEAEHYRFMDRKRQDDISKGRLIEQGKSIDD